MTQHRHVPPSTPADDYLEIPTPLWRRAVSGGLIVLMLFSPLKVTLDQTHLALGLMGQAVAAPIVDVLAPIQFRPTVTQTSTGVPAVNIAAPNAAGVSMNQYQRFDVDSSGLVLNNSQSGGTPLLGGTLGANPNLTGVSANLIVNQVTSTFASSLNGTVEVFGAPAGVIIANPNGVTCTSCGFVNTPRITFTTGTPQFVTGSSGSSSAFDSATAVAFDVRSGRVEVNGNGIEGTVGQIDLIGETIGLDAPLHANYGSAQQATIQLLAGRQRVVPQDDGSYVLSANGADNSAAPVKAANVGTAAVQAGYAIDGSALGAMTAGQIRIIATPAGLGVKTDGALAANTGNLVISANGDLHVADAYAKQSVQLNAAGNLVGSGQVTSGNDVSLSAGGNLTLSGALNSGTTATVQAGGDALLGGTLQAGGNVQLNAGGQLTQSGNASIGGGLNASAAQLLFSGSTQANGSVTLTTSGDSAVGTLSSLGDITLQSGGSSMVNGSATAGGMLSINATAGDLTSTGDLNAGTVMSLIAGNNLTVQGTSSAAQDIIATATNGNLLLAGQTNAGRNLNASAGGQLQTGGVVRVNGDSALSAGSAGMVLGGELDSAGKLTAVSLGDLSANGALASGADLALSSGGSATLSGTLKSLAGLTVSATGNLVLGQSTEAAGNTALTAGGDLSANGDLASTGTLTLTAGNDSHLAGTVQTGGEAHFTAGRDLTIDQALSVVGNATLSAARNLQLGGGASVSGNASLSAAQGAIGVTGDLASQQLSAAAGAGLTVSGNSSAATALALTAGGDMQLGAVNSAGAVTLQSANGGITVYHGLASGDLSLAAVQAVTLLGAVNVSGNADLASQLNSVTLGSDLTANGAVHVQAGQDLSAAGALASNGTVQLSAGRDLQTNGALIAGQALTVAATGQAVLGGPVQSGADADISGASLTLAQLTSYGSAKLTSTSGASLLGDVEAAGALTIKSAGDLTVVGELLGQGGVNGDSGGAASLLGPVLSGQNLTLNAGQQLNVVALSALQDITLNSQAGGIALDDTLVAGGNVMANAASTIASQQDLNAVHGALSLTSQNGDLVLAVLNAGGAVTLGAGRDIMLTGAGNAGAAASLNASRNLSLNGAFAANSITALAGQALVANAPLASLGVATLTGQDVTIGDAIAGGTLNLSAQNQLTLQGNLTGQAGAVLNGASALTVASSGNVDVAGDLTLTAGALNNLGALYAGGTVSANATSLSNRGTVYGSNAGLTLGTLDNSGGKLLAGQDLTATLSSLTANVGGTLGAQRDLNLSVSGAFGAAGGSLVAQRNLSLNLPNTTFDPSAAGSLTAGGTLSVTTPAIVNFAQWAPNANGVALNLQSDFANSGAIRFAGDFMVATPGNVSNSGSIATGGALALSGRNVSNSGQLLANGDLTLSGAVSNRGSLASVGNLNINGAGFDNNGSSAESNGQFNVNVTGAFSNRGGQITVGQDATIQAASFDNSLTDVVDHSYNTTGTNPGLLNPIVLQQGTPRIQLSHGDYVPATPPVTIADLNPDYGSNTVTIQRWDNGSFQQIALPQILRTQYSQASGQGSSLVVLGNASISTVGAANNNGSSISVGGNLTLNAQGLSTARSTSLRNGPVDQVNANDLQRFISQVNSARGVDQCSIWDDCTPVSPYSASAPGPQDGTSTTLGVQSSIRAGGNATLNLGGGTLTLDGALSAGGDLKLQGASLSNAQGSQLLAGRDLRFDLTGTLSNQAGWIEAGRDLTLNAGGVVNQDAGVSSWAQTWYYWGTQVPDAFRNTVLAQVTDPTAQAKLFGETDPDYRTGNTRVHFINRYAIYRDSDTQEPWYTFTYNYHATPAFIVAGRNLDASVAGSLSNSASAITAGNNLSVTAGSVNNAAAQNTAVARVDVGVGSDARWAYTTAASALQAGQSLTVKSGGAVVNSGNIYGTQVSVSGSQITNGYVDPRIPQVASVLPASVISLASPDLAAALSSPLGSLSSALSQSIASPSSGGATPTGPPALTGGPTLILAGVGNVAPVSVASPSISGSFTQAAAPAAAGAVTVATPQYGIPTLAGSPNLGSLSGGQGLQYLHTNPASLSQAALGPDFLISQLPAELVGNAHPFFYADPYTEQQLLQQAALKQTGQLSFINGLAWDDQNNVSVASQQKAILYQNGADFAKANGLQLGQALSPELQAKLDAPMLWYVEQQVPDGHGGSVNALVPTVYLPDASRAQLTNMAGGDIHGQNVSLTASDTIKNTGTLRADDTLSISAKEFTNQKRLGDIGRYTEATEGGYLDISGEKVVQEGAFVSATNLQIQADKIASVSGTFELVGATAADIQARSAAYLAELQAKMGSAFTQSIAQDNLHIEAHVGGGMGVEAVIAIVVAVVVAYFTAGAASGLIASAFNASAGSFMGAAVAATAATSTTAATAAVSAGLGNIMLSGAIAGMASSATSQLITTGKINGSQTLKAGLVQGLTAGIAGGLGSQFGGAPGTAASGTSTVTTSATASIGSRIVGALERAAASSIVQTVVYGSGGESAFTGSLLASAAGIGANEIGAQDWSEAARALAHAGLGCAVAAAGGKDCGSGAIGGAVGSLVASRVRDGLYDGSETRTTAENGDGSRSTTISYDNADYNKAVEIASMTVSGGLALLAGKDGSTAALAAQNEAVNNALGDHLEHEVMHITGTKHSLRAEEEFPGGSTPSDNKVPEFDPLDFTPAAVTAADALMKARTNPSSFVQSRVNDLLSQIPENSKGRITMGVAVVEDSNGVRSVLVSTSEPRGYLRPGVTLQPGETVIAGTGHAEADIVSYANKNGLRVINVGATRPVCQSCQNVIRPTGADIATRLKMPKKGP